jgi:hypothetical protein
VLLCGWCRIFNSPTPKISKKPMKLIQPLGIHNLTSFFPLFRGVVVAVELGAFAEELVFVFFSGADLDFIGQADYGVVVRIVVVFDGVVVVAGVCCIRVVGLCQALAEEVVFHGQAKEPTRVGSVRSPSLAGRSCSKCCKASGVVAVFDEVRHHWATAGGVQLLRSLGKAE